MRGFYFEDNYMTVPSDYDFIGNTITEAHFKNSLTTLLSHIRQMTIDLIEAQGGNYSYASMALFEEDKANISANSTVRIAQGDDAGLYVWDGTNLILAKESIFFEGSNSENLFEWKDNAGNVVLALNKKGQLVSYDEDTKRSILLTNQEDIRELKKFVDELNLNNINSLIKLLDASDSSDLYKFVDSEGSVVLRLTKTGLLRSGQIDSLQYGIDALDYLKPIVKQSDDSKLIKFEDAEKHSWLCR